MHKEDAKVREKESFGQLGLMNGLVAGEQPLVTLQVKHRMRVTHQFCQRVANL